MCLLGVHNGPCLSIWVFWEEFIRVSDKPAATTEFFFIKCNLNAILTNEQWQHPLMFWDCFGCLAHLCSLGDFFWDFWGFVKSLWFIAGAQRQKLQFILFFFFRFCCYVKHLSKHNQDQVPFLCLLRRYRFSVRGLSLTTLKQCSRIDSNCNFISQDS